MLNIWIIEPAPANPVSAAVLVLKCDFGVLVSQEELGDQRAKDLIDEAEDLEPDKAIKLLKRALRYGKTGIQASKAYLGLGMRYEDLGKIELAITYYTEALGAWKPFAIAYLWRGKLYYQQKQWKKAQSDFERVLSLASETYLPPEEQNEAEQFLNELRELTQ